MLICMTFILKTQTEEKTSNTFTMKSIAQTNVYQ